MTFITTDSAVITIDKTAITTDKKHCLRTQSREPGKAGEILCH
ncbi:hypothetical protein YpAngola_A4106 [Yersinia pestis Angola]|nr:hypothetical protein YpAngola_A4106 [Yersinia pestis Angola]